MDTAETQQISIAQILSMLRKHIGLIFFSTLLVTLLSGFVTFFVMTPKYSATTQILVNRKLSDDMAGAQLQQAQADVQMINTYKDIITSPAVLKDVNAKMQGVADYPGDVDDLKGMISVASQQNSQVFSVTAKSKNPNTAAKIANAVASTFKQKVVKIMSINNVSIVSKAAPEDKPVSPRTKLNLAAGVVLGFLIGVGLAFLRELSDRTVTSEEFLVDELGLKSLGIVSEISERDVRRKIAVRTGIQNETNTADASQSRMRRRV